MHQYTLETHVSRTAVKFLTFAATSLVVTFGLFALMQYLIKSDSEWTEPQAPVALIDPVFEEQEPEDIIEKTLPPPEAPKVTPKPLPPEQASSSDDDSLNTGLNNFTLTPPVHQFTSVPNLQGAGGDARPMVQIEPKYPIKAAQSGVEGWVKLVFDISAQGTVENVRVLEAEPKRVFESAAKRALKRWKYKPKMIEGKPAIQRDVLVQLEFNLDQS